MLKYEDDRFENASVEFDDVKLQPTFRLLWGLPGRSNALNIAARLGLEPGVIDIARSLLGSTQVRSVGDARCSAMWGAWESVRSVCELGGAHGPSSGSFRIF